ncbi:MAG: helix-turn-helix domain-containing protein, partial [Rhodospirillales bacterium]|nr:helix-turn-helix domain-containing protein [Rhodospirillales bacterium]
MIASAGDAIDVEVGRRLRVRREMLGLPRAELALALGITPQFAARLEKGQRPLSSSMLWRAAKVLKVPVAYFFDDCGLLQDNPAGDMESREMLTL